MLIPRRREWNLTESDATPESLALNRRSLMKGLAGGVLGLGISGEARAADVPGSSLSSGPGSGLVSGAAMRFDPGRAVTPSETSERYNNFYEFGLSKDIWRSAQQLPIDPWTIEIGGLVEKPFKISFDDLIKKVQTDTRIYRHRRVEAWAMTVPWTGFPMSELVKLAKPAAAAKYIRFTTLEDAKTMPGLSVPFFPWPYQEGVSMAEAANELAFFATGLYGKPLPKQDGAPLRVVLPWKYGFKSAKSIVKIEFIVKQPMTFWEKTSPDMFWANVNPDYPTLRWSQARERLIGTGTTVPTVIYNGYGKWVAPLYLGMKQDRVLFM